MVVPPRKRGQRILPGGTVTLTAVEYCEPVPASCSRPLPPSPHSAHEIPNESREPRRLRAALAPVGTRNE